MKKLLLLLFISLGLISPANANSIKGAFGYNLGEVYKTSDNGKIFHNYIPKTSYPDLDKYTVATTLTDKRIFRIIALTRKDSHTSYACRKGSYLPFRKLLNLLQNKYGQFKKALDEKSEYLDWVYEKVEYVYEDEDRYIYLSCSTGYENGIGTYILKLEYIDSTLFRQWRDESFEKRQKEDSGLLLIL